MARSDQPILVTGGTGHQGGAVARHLLADEWLVRALVRDADKPASRALAEAGARLVVGDLRDKASLEVALDGAYGVHSVQSLADGPEAELEEGRLIADVAKAAGVKHFVYSSVIGADRDSALPWVGSKHRIEQHLTSLGLPLTIWRPTTFMEAMSERQHDGILAGKLTGFEPADVRHQWIAADDIGRFVALAFAHPETWIGRTTEIAGDDPTGAEAAKTLGTVLGITVVYEQAPPRPGVPAPAPPAADAPPPRKADIEALRAVLPSLKTLRAWARDLHERGVW